METIFASPTAKFSDHLGHDLNADQLQQRLVQLAYCVTDSHGCFVEVNDNYLELYGYSKEELIGKHFTMVVPEEAKEYAKNLHDEFIAGEEEMPKEWDVVGKDGLPRRIYVEAIRVKDTDNEDDQPKKMTVIENLTK